MNEEEFMRAKERWSAVLAEDYGTELDAKVLETCGTGTLANMISSAMLDGDPKTKFSRECPTCRREIFLYDYLLVNIERDPRWVMSLWRDPRVGIPCCFCYDALLVGKMKFPPEPEEKEKKKEAHGRPIGPHHHR